METFFRWPVASIALGVTLAVALLLLGFGLLAWRAPLLPKLGLRNIGRRPLRAALIVAGLMLSTTVIGSAFGTGDAMTHTFHTLITGSLGTVDEVVVSNPDRVRRGGFRVYRQVQALTQPGLAQSTAGLGAVQLASIEQATAERLMEATRGSQAIAAIAPAIVEQVAVVYGPSQQLQSSISLLAVAAPLPPETQQAFGALTTLDGQPLALESLAPDEVVLNAAAAESFSATAGQTLSIVREGQTWSRRIRAVVGNGGIAGSQPQILVPLAQHQQTIYREGLINQLLIANRGGTASVARSAEAARELRALLVDREIAAKLHALLARPDVQRGLIEVEGALEERDRERFAALRAEAARPEMSDEFVSLITDPRIRQRLFVLAWRLPTTIDGDSPRGLLQNVSRFSVLEVKQEALDQAQQYGAAVTTVFLVLGIFSIVASVLLVFLIFALLAADRSAELATMRALGMRRWQIMGLFLWEGLVYDLLGALLGTLASLAGSYGIVRALSQALIAFGVEIEPHIAPTSLVITSAGGVLLTFGAMLLAAWRVSRVEIVAGTRGEAVAESQRWLLGLGMLLLVAAGLLWWRGQPDPELFEPRHPLLVPATISLVLAGLFCSIRPLLGARATPLLLRTLATMLGLALLGIWLRLLLSLPAPGGDLSRNAVVATAAGVVLIAATVWIATQGLDPLLRAIDWGLRGLSRLRVIVRPAVGYLSQQRLRTGLTVVMFGLIVTIMVVALTLIDVVINAYAADEPPVAGYELRGDGAVGDIEAALASAPAVSRDDFSAIGSIARAEAAIVQPGLLRSRWTDAPLIVGDDGFLAGIQARMQQRAGGYTGDAAVWETVREQTGAAVITGRLPRGMSLPAAAYDDDFTPFTVWARSAQGGAPVKLSVIGVVDARSELESGLYISQATAQTLGTPIAPPETYFFAVRPEVQLRDAAEGLRISFGSGLSISVLGEALKIIQAVRLLLVRLVQGFMGLGLIAGIAALGLLGVQSVLERRQQLGALRALGFTRFQMRASFIFESSVIAALGITVGIALGLILARSLVAVLASAYPELRFAIPWSQIGLTAATAWLGAQAAILLAAWQAGRVAPADALRVV
ncbi:MAG TPA: FtsX-like permease family protein [Herpetosiphonaceae bacterium]